MVSAIAKFMINVQTKTGSSQASARIQVRCKNITIFATNLGTKIRRT